MTEYEIPDAHEDRKNYWAAEKLRQEARMFELKNKEMAMGIRDLEATSDEAHIYTFYTAVMGSSVIKCMYTLDAWSRRAPGCEMTIIFNSPGGTVSDGFALFDFLRDLSNRGHKIVVKAYGMAASMGAILMQAGDERVMSKNSFMMIHEGQGGMEGSLAEMTDTIKLFNKFQDKAIDILTAKSTLSKSQITRLWKKTDYWMSAEEALEKGFIDRIE